MYLHRSPFSYFQSVFIAILDEHKNCEGRLKEKKRNRKITCDKKIITKKIMGYK